MTPANPLPTELSAQLAALSPTQLAWLSGYCWAQSQGAAGGLSVSAAPAVAAPRATRVGLIRLANGQCARRCRIFTRQTQKRRRRSRIEQRG